MHVLVTGSSGGIGSKTVELLRKSGYTVRTLDRQGAEFNTDLRDYEAVLEALQGIDAVVHSGAVPSDWDEHEVELMATNALGTFHIFQGCAIRGIRRVVAFSSVQALGVFARGADVSSLPLTDAHVPVPMSPYQLSKHIGEDIAAYFYRIHGIQSVSLRPVFVAHERHYEGWDKPENQAKRAEWGRHEVWAYVDVRDVCDAVLRALTAETLTAEGLLLAAADTTSVIPTAELVERYYSDFPWIRDKEEYLAQGAYVGLVDTSRAKEVLGWEAKHSWRE
ncbi:MAG: NAD(P)-dependent oxidoreductase [Armatimonas sp.]